VRNKEKMSILWMKWCGRDIEYNWNALQATTHVAAVAGPTAEAKF